MMMMMMMMMMLMMMMIMMMMTFTMTMTMMKTIIDNDYQTLTTITIFMKRMNVLFHEVLPFRSLTYNPLGRKWKRN
jgi:hypothetical protein